MECGTFCESVVMRGEGFRSERGIITASVTVTIDVDDDADLDERGDGESPSRSNGTAPLHEIDEVNEWNINEKGNETGSEQVKDNDTTRVFENKAGGNPAETIEDDVV